MRKRFLAILAIVATTFAFGAGAVLAERPEHAGPPADKCEASDGRADGCANHPGDDTDDTDDGDEGPSPQDICDAIRDLDENLAPVADGCDQIVAALTGEGGGVPSLPAPPDGLPVPPEGGGAPSCDQIPVEQLVDGCEQVVDALTEAGLPI